MPPSRRESLPPASCVSRNISYLIVVGSSSGPPGDFLSGMIYMYRSGHTQAEAPIICQGCEAREDKYRREWVMST